MRFPVIATQAPLNWAWVPDGQRGWTGYSGSNPVQGPLPRPDGYVDPPKPEETVEAEVLTTWECHACGKSNQVSGEGAVYSWMECSSCKAESYLVME